jgi:hypothetical protein
MEAAVNAKLAELEVKLAKREHSDISRRGWSAKRRPKPSTLCA